MFTDCNRCVNCGRKIDTESQDVIENSNGEYPWAVHLSCFNRPMSFYQHPIAETRALLLDYVYRAELKLSRETA